MAEEKIKCEVVGPIEFCDGFTSPGISARMVATSVETACEVRDKLSAAGEKALQKAEKEAGESAAKLAAYKTLLSKRDAYRDFLTRSGKFVADLPENPLLLSILTLLSSGGVVRPGHCQLMSISSEQEERIKASLSFRPTLSFTRYSVKAGCRDTVDEETLFDTVMPWWRMFEYFLSTLKGYLNVISDVARITHSSMVYKCIDARDRLLSEVQKDGVSPEYLALVSECFCFARDLNERIHGDTCKAMTYKDGQPVEEVLFRSLDPQNRSLYAMCDRVIQSFIASIDMIKVLPVKEDCPKVTYSNMDPLWVQKMAATLPGAMKNDYYRKVEAASRIGVKRSQSLMPTEDMVHGAIHVFQPEFLRLIDTVGTGMMDSWYRMERKGIVEALETYWGRFLDLAEQTLGGGVACMRLRYALQRLISHVAARMRGLPVGLCQSEYKSAYHELESAFEGLAEAMSLHDAETKDPVPSYEVLTCDGEKTKILRRPRFLAEQQYNDAVRDMGIDRIDFDEVVASIPDIMHFVEGGVRFPASTRKSIIAAFVVEGRLLYQKAVFNDKYRLPNGARPYDVVVVDEVPAGGRTRGLKIESVRRAVVKLIEGRIAVNNEKDDTQWIARRWRSALELIVGREDDTRDVWCWRAYSPDQVEEIVAAVESCASADVRPDAVNPTTKALEGLTAMVQKLMKPDDGRKFLAAVTQEELAYMLGYKNGDSVRKWEAGDRRCPADYTRSLRVQGGIPLMAFINRFRRDKGITKPLQAIKNGKIVDLSMLTEADADLVLEFVRKKSAAAEAKNGEMNKRKREAAAQAAERDRHDA